jgi:hypothetical protein
MIPLLAGILAALMILGAIGAIALFVDMLISGDHPPSPWNDDDREYPPGTFDDEDSQ